MTTLGYPNGGPGPLTPVATGRILHSLVRAEVDVLRHAFASNTSFAIRLDSGSGTTSRQGADNMANLVSVIAVGHSGSCP